MGQSRKRKRVERVLRAGPAATAQQHCKPVTKATGVMIMSKATEMAHATLLRLNVSEGTSWIAVRVIAGTEASTLKIPPEAYEDWSESRDAVRTAGTQLLDMSRPRHPQGVNSMAFTLMTGSEIDL